MKDPSKCGGELELTPMAGFGGSQAAPGGAGGGSEALKGWRGLGREGAGGFACIRSESREMTISCNAEIFPKASYTAAESSIGTIHLH